MASQPQVKQIRLSPNNFMRSEHTASSSWQSYLTLDVVAAAARQSIFHPMLAWMMPLSLRALTVPYDHLSFRLTGLYAILLTLYYALSAVNRKVAYGPSRQIDLLNEVVVITGGSGGLGHLIADFYRMRGASVAIMDVKPPVVEDGSSITFYQCDVGNAARVATVARQIKDELGTPTILINNAAVTNSQTILELSVEQVERTFRVNLMSHFFTTKAFLPDMLEYGSGTIVTVASILGYLGCAYLSDYTASKAGLLAFHASLRAELSQSKHPSARNIKTILVTPGQLGTPLFDGMQTPSGFLAPVVEPVTLAKEVVRIIDDGDGGEVRLPFYTNFIPVISSLPASLQLLVRWLSGMDKAMYDFAAVRAHPSAVRAQS